MSILCSQSLHVVNTKTVISCHYFGPGAFDVVRSLSSRKKIFRSVANSSHSPINHHNDGASNKTALRSITRQPSDPEQDILIPIQSCVQASVQTCVSAKQDPLCFSKRTNISCHYFRAKVFDVWKITVSKRNFLISIQYCAQALVQTCVSAKQAPLSFLRRASGTRLFVVDRVVAKSVRPNTRIHVTAQVFCLTGSSWLIKSSSVSC